MVGFDVFGGEVPLRCGGVTMLCCFGLLWCFALVWGCYGGGLGGVLVFVWGGFLGFVGLYVVDCLAVCIYSG